MRWQTVVLPPPEGPTKATVLPSLTVKLRCERTAVSPLIPIMIGKGHVVKDDVAAQKIDGHGVFGLALCRQGEHFAEAREAREAVLDLLEQVDEGAHGSQQHGDVEDEGGVVAGADLIEAEKQPRPPPGR